jgi:hypothetical protein
MKRYASRESILPHAGEVVNNKSASPSVEVISRALTLTIANFSPFRFGLGLLKHFSEFINVAIQPTKTSSHPPQETFSLLPSSLSLKPHSDEDTVQTSLQSHNVPKQIPAPWSKAYDTPPTRPHDEPNTIPRISISRVLGAEETHYVKRGGNTRIVYMGVGLCRGVFAGLGVLLVGGRGDRLL